MHKNKIDGVKNRITQKLTVCQNFDSLIHLKENIYKIINFDLLLTDMPCLSTVM